MARWRHAVELALTDTRAAMRRRPAMRSAAKRQVSNEL
jgi:hypothetical protein